MPIYEYKCKKCGHVFEVRQSFSDAPIQTCNKDGCNGQVRKLFSPPAIIFKGSGFYVTDNARQGRGSAGGNGRGATEKAEAAADKAKDKAEDKPKDKAKEKAEATTGS